MSLDYATAREIMVDSQMRTHDVTNVALLQALGQVARERFVPAGRGHLAYADTEIEYAPGRWMLRPRDISKLLQNLAPQRGEAALAIAAPYAAAVLEVMGLVVTRVETPDLAVPAGTFDVIVCEGAVSKVPQAWLAALNVRGRLGVVERNGPVGRAMLYLRTADQVAPRVVFDSTPPILAGFEAHAGFVF